jgi:hypothetical protein
MSTKTCGIGWQLVLFSAAWLLLPVSRLDAQTIGTFKWQQQPYCNVVTVTVTLTGTTYRLEGTDDQCGATRQASAIGTAFLNANGFVGMGLTIVTNDGGGNGGLPVHLDAVISLANLHGTWRDNTGQTGAFTFVTASLGGPSRPTPVLAPGFVSTPALAPAAVTGDKLAPASITSDKFAASAFSGRPFDSLVAMGTVYADGAKSLVAGSNLVVSRSAPGTYTLTAPGLDPGCVHTRLLGVVPSSTTPGTIATPNDVGSIICATGDSSTSVTVRNLAGALVDSAFTMIVYKSGS